MSKGKWLVAKSGCYYRPMACGYTKWRDDAGLFDEAEARRHASLDDGLTIVRWEDARQKPLSWAEIEALRSRLALPKDPST